MPHAAFADENLFAPRHHGRPAADTQAMLQAVGVASVDELIDKTIPQAIRLKTPMPLPGAEHGVTEAQALQEVKALAAQNTVKRSMIGQGYHGTHTPPVILRNVLENPLWYTPYTPYQPEISQGRLEALLNFQTMISDLTGLPVANASLLDEATAAAEAMAMCFAIGRQKKTRFIASESCHPQTLAVLATRADTMGIELMIEDPRNAAIDETVCGVLVQYPDTEGYVHDYDALCETVHAAGGLVVAACDILSLCLLTPPGEWNQAEEGAISGGPSGGPSGAGGGGGSGGGGPSGGADIVVGNTQRFGVPMGYGGPHAAYMATHEKHVRKMPGRLIGVTRDAHGDKALRLSIQTREQHIKRDRATSNICTAQALLANVAGFYAVWHGPAGLKNIATRVHRFAGLIKQHLDDHGLATNGSYFDTITATVRDADPVIERAAGLGVNLRRISDRLVSVACDETTTLHDVFLVLQSFGVPVEAQDLAASSPPPSPMKTRRSPFLQHPVFNLYHTEHELLRYLTRLQSRDISLANSMICLGSCTMKLNAAAEMIPVTLPGFADLHPYAPASDAPGYAKLFKDLEAWLAAVTGLPGVSLQPNAGSQGEYAGLLAIKRFHEANNDGNRTICLIPTSAHGTNPASAVIAGMKVVPVGCLDNGDIDLDDLKAKAQKHAAGLAALMITYPSTHGVFEENVQAACRIVHDHGGKVYMDGANMNAQVGLTNPAVCGADVCHLNLHKTFCIPHGGGGPGMGPICCTQDLAPHLPQPPESGNPSGGAVSAAHYGSPMILPISWMYIRMMGADGLTQATQNAILNANYMASSLKDSYDVLYTGPNGTCAHEFILDCRPFQKSAQVTVEDLAKRLIDFGFHAPTMSWPVAGTLMIEPTESETKAELDRFIQAMQTIRQEIAAIESGQLDPQDNPLKHAPHTAEHVASDAWPHTYPRKQGAYPAAWLKEHGAKYWPPVGRVDNAFGDRNLVCTCPSVEELACEVAG